MYVDILWSALDAFQVEPDVEGALHEAVSRRAEILRLGPSRPGRSAVPHLAAAIAYDRALMALCALLGIATEAKNFEHPGPERDRLESALRTVGVDLVGLTRQRYAPDHRSPGVTEDSARRPRT